MTDNNNESIDKSWVQDLCQELLYKIRNGATLQDAKKAVSRTLRQEPVELDIAAQIVEKEHLKNGAEIDISDIALVIRNPEQSVPRTSIVDVDYKYDLYWPPVRDQIATKLPDAVDSIHASSNAVINEFPPPSTEGFNVKGLVVGYVQSGKTTNFMSVIAKAADRGFRLIIVLTGMTENLRYQTQDRLERQLIANDHANWYRLTTTDHDFRGDNNPQRLKDTNIRFIAVVKKNAKRLLALNNWINKAGDLGDRCPILVIDDEADQASIDVSSPSSKNRRSAINKQISDLLNHQRTIYVAYTATPFANVLIDPNKMDDLYPSNFIHVLPEPKGYFGTQALFGREPLRGEDHEFNLDDGYDMIRIITEDEVDGIKPPPSTKNQDKIWQPQSGPALRDSLRWFIMATAARWARGQKDEHSSMLIHTSMLTESHDDLEDLVKQEYRRINGEIKDPVALAEWKQLWEFETEAVNAEQFGLNSLAFETIEEFIPEVLSKLEIRKDNAQSDNRLDYDSKNPKPIIAIGGNTLSRGLTLEGLVSSYFVRQASAYDTLLQMGRWFGFRNGYQDMPRVWMPEELISWFRDLAFVEAELRQELAVYAEEKMTPIDVRTKIRKHPSMMITARAKMQDAQTAFASYSGQRVQTIKFKADDSSWLEHNIKATKRFINAVASGKAKRQDRRNGTVVFRGVSTETVLSFLNDYQFHENTRLGKDEASLIRQYIVNEDRARLLGKWNVSIFGQTASTGTPFDLGNDVVVQKIRRSKLDEPNSDGANIKTLTGSLDRLNDLPFEDEQWRALVNQIESKAQRLQINRESLIRKAHAEHAGSNTPHLAIYVIDKDSTARTNLANKQTELTKTHRKSVKRVDLNASADVIGVAMFFPDSPNPNSGVEYVMASTPTDEIRTAYAVLDEEYAAIDELEEDRLQEEENAKRRL